MSKLWMLILALCLLAGCGGTQNDRTDGAGVTTPPRITQELLPEPEDGEVTDRNGIIGDEDRKENAGDPGVKSGNTQTARKRSVGTVR